MKIVEIILTNKDAADIVHTAVEGGTNYWAEVKNYNWKDWYEPDPTKLNDTYKSERIKESLAEDHIFVQIREDDEQVEPERAINTWIPVTRIMLEKGVKMLLENMPHLIGHVERDDEGGVEMDFDGTACDVIMQYAIFEEVIYG
jgi:hypothetical protein